MTHNWFWLTIFSHYRWTNNDQVDFINWHQNEPNDEFGAERCVAIKAYDGMFKNHSKQELNVIVMDYILINFTKKQLNYFKYWKKSLLLFTDYEWFCFDIVALFLGCSFSIIWTSYIQITIRQFNFISRKVSDWIKNFVNYLIDLIL